MRQSYNYIPDLNHPQATPVRYIRVNFHIMQCQRQRTILTNRRVFRFCREMVEQSNYRWSNNFKMNLPEGNSTENMDIPIRVVLMKDAATGGDAIYFHPQRFTLLLEPQPEKGYASLGDQTAIDMYHIGGDSVINIFWWNMNPTASALPLTAVPLCPAFLLAATWNCSACIISIPL